MKENKTHIYAVLQFMIIYTLYTFTIQHATQPFRLSQSQTINSIYTHFSFCSYSTLASIHESQPSGTTGADFSQANTV